MVISSTIVKAFLRGGTLKRYCPKYVKEVVIERNYDITSLAMLKGNFFETLCLGSGREGKIVDSLPLRKNGEKTIDQIRIEKQSENFKRLCSKYGIVLSAENTQVNLRKKLGDVYLEGHPDICPVALKDPSLGLTLGIVDLKLAKNLRNTFGDFAWGDYHNMDTTQADIYLYLTEDLDLSLNSHLNKEVFEIVSRRDLQMYFWVFSYWEGKLKDEQIPLQNMIIRTEKSLLKRKELLESLRKVYKLIRHHDSEGWKAVPGDPCEHCPVDCPVRVSSDTIKKRRKLRREKFKKELGEFKKL